MRRTLRNGGGAMRRTLVCMAAAALLLSSCIRDEITYCRALSVTLAVHDKNYDNVDLVEPELRESEALPLRSYVSTLKWTLRDAATGEVVEEQPMDSVRTDARELDITFCDCVPHGTYVLTTYGQLAKESQVDMATGRVALHPDGTEDGDIFISNDTLVYDPWHDHYRAELWRAKDQVLIEVEGLPEEGYTATLTATHLRAVCDPTVDPPYEHIRFAYHDFTTVTHRTVLREGEPFATVLAPTADREKTRMHLTLTPPATDPDDPTLVPDDVTLDLERNMLAVIRYVYEPDKRTFQIYVCVNGSWELVNSMDLD